MVSFEKLNGYNPQITGTSFAPAEKVAFAGGGNSTSNANYAQYDTPQNTVSSGVYGEVSGTGNDGVHRLNMYM